MSFRKPGEANQPQTYAVATNLINLLTFDEVLYYSCVVSSARKIMSKLQVQELIQCGFFITEPVDVCNNR